MSITFQRGMPLWAAMVAAGLLCACAPGIAAPSPQVATTIKADVAELIAGINAHDVDRATQFDAPEIVSMEAGRLPAVGAAAERQGFSAAFQYAPSWRLHLIDETVDVSASGDMAVYRSTYDENSVEGGVAMTHKVNFLTGWTRQPDGSWKVGWSVVSAQTPSHPAT